LAAHNETGYVFRDRHPERADVYEESAQARRTLKCLLDAPYGADPRETFDLFPGGTGAPLLVFVHGGYWQSQSKDRYSFVAQRFVERGFSVALPNYPLAPEASIERIVECVSRSVRVIAETLANAGHMPSFWIASGHSAGGHLAAMLATSNAAKRRLGIPLAGCAPISGIFDLVPLIATSLNEVLGLDRGRADSLSPVKLLPFCGRLVAFVGDLETSDFIGQSSDYVRHCISLGGKAELLQLRERNHYTILCDLMGESSVIAAAIISLGESYWREEKPVERR
jgi:arylformamidase